MQKPHYILNMDIEAELIVNYLLNILVIVFIWYNILWK